ncbi:winged helix-turn-helix domain-containing protein [Vibrio penaeicida]|uniref:winged helix-turn-helix domain-containing protein n=1 Tax=Vibrio penaeicida TaxID=104609 RepID=UPI000CEA55F9|nr:response regulator transcription factor [Vibrio penaeicida]
MNKSINTVQYNVAYITDRGVYKEPISRIFKDIKVNIFFYSGSFEDSNNVSGTFLDSNINFSAIVIDKNIASDSELHRTRSFIKNSDLSSIIICRDKKSAFSIINSGADDFLVPPYTAEELTLRIINVSQRNHMPHLHSESHVSFGKYSLHLETRELKTQDINKSLTDGEHMLLLHLIGNKGKYSSREELSLALGKKRHPMSSRSVDMLIGRLRRKIDDNPKMPQYIVTSRGKGYMLVREPE